VIEFGSLDATAERLHVTPSAVSQRNKAVEQRVGQVLVVREKPSRATSAGVPLLWLAAQTAMLGTGGRSQYIFEEALEADLKWLSEHPY
jgi:LysR family transcriptional regulator (chromosome initiation inhibitor)